MNIYISGLYGSKNSGLYQFIMSRYPLDRTLFLSQDFMKKKWKEQLFDVWSLINTDQNINIIAVSYGAYLLLNSLHHLQDTHHVRVLLISPVLGPMLHPAGGRIPKGYKEFKRRLENTGLGIPEANFLITGSDDPVNKPYLASLVKNNPHVNCTLVQNQGHQLDHQTIQQSVDDFMLSA